MDPNNELQTSKLIVSWHKYLSEAEKLYLKIKDNKYDEIVAINRGGLALGLILSHKFNTKLSVIDPKEISKEHIHSEVQSNIKKILLVDDLSDTGKTFLQIMNNFCSCAYDVDSAAIYVKPWTSVIPKYWNIITKKYIIFPWEEK